MRVIKDEKTVSVPSSSGHGVQPGPCRLPIRNALKFQSPPHRGTVFSGPGKGHRACLRDGFSPLLIGARCSAGKRATGIATNEIVSVPSSSGHGVQPGNRAMGQDWLYGFSPLLIGARCSAGAGNNGVGERTEFQSPPHRGTVFSDEKFNLLDELRRGFSPLLIGARCSANEELMRDRRKDWVSVPSSSGHGVQPLLEKNLAG